MILGVYLGEAHVFVILTPLLPLHWLLEFVKHIHLAWNCGKCADMFIILGSIIN